MALQSGDIDILGLSATDAAQLKSSHKITVAPKVGWGYLGMNVENPVLKDKRVHQALFYAIDRERVRDQINKGFVDLTCQPWPKTSPAFSADLEKPHHDPDRAKSLLKQAGYSGEQVKIEYIDNGGPLLQSIQQQLSAVGFNLQLVPTEGNAWTAKFAQGQFSDMWQYGNAFANLTPITLFEQSLPFRSGNPSHYTNPDYFDKIAGLEKVDASSDEAKAAYEAINTLFVDDSWMIPLYATQRIDVARSNVQSVGDYWIMQYLQVNVALIWKSA